MKLQYAAFHLPVYGSAAEQEELNRFLRGHRTVQTWREFIDSPGNPGWAILVEYMAEEKGGERQLGKVDYKEILSENDFAVFCKLRDVRKSLAEKNGLPVYAVFTNDQLADIARQKPSSKTGLMRIDGIGQGKSEKFEDEILACIAGTLGEESRMPPG